MTDEKPADLGLDDHTWNLLLSIEELAAQWVIPNKPFEHSYGRLPDEVEIRAWSVPRNTGLFLYSLCRILRPKHLLEIGTSFAYSTLWLAAGAGQNARIHTIEALPEKQQIASQHVASSGYSNITIVNARAEEVIPTWKSPVDFLFMDADPSNYELYFDHLLPSLQARAVLVMDNALNHVEVTAPFARHLARQSGWESWIHPLDNGLLLGVRV